MTAVIRLGGLLLVLGFVAAVGGWVLRELERLARKEWRRVAP